ncbi:hypothetical protein ACP275_06G086200 [Erythranthe tilingii]
MDRKFVVTMMLFFLLSVVSLERAEGKLCSASSQLFRGLCIIERNCLTACEKEGFEDGKCEGVLMQCICYKSCGSSTTTHPITPPN